MSHYITLRQSILADQGLDKEFSTPLELDREKLWEVALLECLFPSRIGQIEEGEIFGYVEFSGDKRGWVYPMTAERGVRCSNLQLFIEHINAEHLFHHGAALNVVLSPKGGKRLIVQNNNLEGEVKIKFNEKVAAILGFKPHIYYKGGDESLYNCDLEAGTHNLFIYGDCIQDSLLADTLAPIFRIISMKKGSDFTHTIFKVPHYIPLTIYHLNQIRLLIYDVGGQPVTLPSGLASFIFHIRQRKA